MNPPQLPSPVAPQWRARRLKRWLPWDKGPVRPAEVLHRLEDILLDDKLLVEDANYHRYAPNHYVVELNSQVYQELFEPIEAQVTHQWQQQLQEHLATANSRQGKLVYRLVGPLVIELHPSPALGQDEARFLFRLDRQAGRPAPLPFCLERPEDGRRYPLTAGVLTIGRDPANDIPLDNQAVQNTRLVSSRHAYLQCTSERIVIFDGEPGGMPSTNGTYVNGQRLLPGGRELHDGDTIIFAALHPNHPDPLTPGAGLLLFKAVA